jgi:hypothetical protein
MPALIHPDDKIKILYTEDGTTEEKSVGELFHACLIYRIRHARYNHIDDEDWGNTIIMSDLYDSPVNIQDNTGWSELISIIRVPGIVNEFSKIKVADKTTLLSNDYIVPTYDLNKQSIGFHGEVKYEVKPKKVSDLSGDDYLRVYRGNGGITEFEHPSIIHNMAAADGYVLKTKSGSFNLDGIIMLI